MGHHTTDRVAANVRAELARRSLSGRTLAAEMGWSVSSTSRRLSGQHPFTVDELARVAEYLNVSLGFLLPDESAVAS